MAMQKSGKKPEFNIDDLLEESDDDDDNLFDDDEEMQKFKEKAGLGSSKSGLGKVDPLLLKSKTEDPKLGLSSSGYTFSSSLKPADSAQMKLQQQSTVTIGAESSSVAPGASSIETASLQPQKTKYDANYISSESDDDDDEEDDTELFIQHTKGMKLTTPAYTTQQSSAKKQDSFLKTKGEDDLDLSPSKAQELKQTAITDILEVIEKNEKMNEVGPDKIIEHAGQLLSFDNKFYNVQKKLFDYQDFGDISRKLHQQKNHQFQGLVSALTVVQNYLFVGNSSGIIRVFDVKSQKEMKPLMDDRTIGQNKVTCLDISDDGGFLISGYKKGQVALWDLVNYKLIRYIEDIHQTDVVNAKIYNIDENENLFAVSAEDSGRVQLIKFSKKSFLGGYSSEAQFLFKTRLKGTATIAVQRRQCFYSLEILIAYLLDRNELYPHKYCDNSQLVAFGSLNEIVLCQMKPIKEIFQILRPAFCKEKSIPYVDWGYGLTPSQRERTVPIMAFAWDRLIQLVYINEEKSTIEMDGFYYSDSEINQLYFMGDSILFALVNSREVKVLYTTKFYPGHFKFLENAKKDDLLNNQFEKVIQVTAHAELEKGFEISDIKSNLLQSQMVMNYNQCVRKYKNLIFFMCGKTVVRGKLFNWKEYLDHIKFKENYDWLTVLKVALEIYNGETKGYCKVPDEKEKREGQLKAFMKDMIKDSVNQVILKFSKQQTQSPAAGKEEKKESDIYQADAIAIKVAIEFCLSINATFYLFTDIYQIFYEAGLESKFIANLEPFILSGSFRKEIIPEYIVKKIINFYEEKNNLKVLEKVIQSLDLSDYQFKDELMVLCQIHCLIGALLYLMSAQAEEQLGCMQILNTLLSLMRKARNVEVTKDEIMLVTKCESAKKFEIEKSRAYIGYKLLWIIKLFLDGKTYPSGYLDKVRQRMHAYDIANFVTTDQYLDELMEFDSEYLFKVIAKLFSGESLKFLMTQKAYLDKNAIKGFILCPPPEAMIQIFQERCKSNPIREENFDKFLILVQSQQLNPDTPKLNINNSLIIKAVFNTIVRQKDETVQSIEDQMIIATLQSIKLQKEDIEKLLSQLEIQTRPQVSLRIFLVEKKKDWVQSFKLNLQNTELRKKIFEWIHATLDKLSRNGKTTKPFDDLKQVIQRSIKELISINVGDCVLLLDKWFEDTYQEQLILEELTAYPEVQFNYLKKFLKQNEPKIQQTINDSALSSDRRAEAQRYLQYLLLHTRLLCIYEPADVHEYVKKDYYPAQECLEICKANHADRGAAVLQKRNGNYIEAIDTYLSIITMHIDLNELVKELNQSSKGKASSSAAASALAKHKPFKWEFLQCQNFPLIQEFDELLKKCIRIAEKYDTVIGEEGWFKILEFLSDYNAKTIESLSKKVKDQTKLDRMIQFISQRKSYVLKAVPTTISLETLTERLNLNFQQIKQLYDDKIEVLRSNGKYIKLAKLLQEKEINILQESLFTEVKKGFHLQEAQKCFQCDMKVGQSVQKLPFKIFYCGHTFHLNCIKDKKCPFCVKQSIEIKSKSELRKSSINKKDADEKAKAKEAEKSVQYVHGLAEAAFASPDKPGLDIKADALFNKRMEVFNQQLDNYGLALANFT